MKATHPLLAVPITIAAMFAQVIIGTLPVTLLPDPGHPLSRLAGAIGITLASLGLIYLIRRYLGRQPWRGVGLDRSRRALPHVLLGLLAGAVPVLAASALSVALGAATTVPWAVLAPQVPYLLLAVVFTLLSQAFPEELLWRGHLFDTLSSRLSPRAVIIVVSVGFGAMHIVSQSPATTPLERLLYVLHATALGFACAAARARTGTVWMAVGVHLGLHTGNYLFPTQPVAYGVQLIILTCTFTLSTLLLMHRPKPDHNTTPEQPPATVA
ncbi:Membrane protease YdiL, CAAX protease family [Nonomuraea solani]|uniref:Membrane protease YdiL, CAAX protease family n=1 Tax=Nonomuraea solani TaxID=1144553 RepID=A0A1H6DEN7_9ACTN|nr:type II CAAX endopeptidase family protein [Nonomuraea solani]SEG83694.1 Membrane protease YdiL, CAAX protease family [Nonomuraea solani]